MFVMQVPSIVGDSMEYLQMCVYILQYILHFLQYMCWCFFVSILDSFVNVLYTYLFVSLLSVFTGVCPREEEGCSPVQGTDTPSPGPARVKGYPQSRSGQ